MHIDGKVKQILQSSIASVLQKSGTSTNVEINAAIISAAINNAPYYWYMADMGDDIEQLEDAVVPFIINGLQN